MKFNINCNANWIKKKINIFQTQNDLKTKRASLTLLSNSKMLIVQETESLQTDFNG